MTMELGSMKLSCVPSSLPHAYEKLAKISEWRFGDITSPCLAPPGVEGSRSPGVSSRISSSRGFVGMVEPPERIAQIGIGIQCKREPSFARGVGVEADVVFGSFQKRRQYGIKFQKDGGVWTEPPGVGEGGKDSFSAIKCAEPEHALGDHTGPGEQFGFEQGRPSAHFFGDGQELASWTRRRRAAFGGGLAWLHRLLKWPSSRGLLAEDGVAAQ